MRACVVAFLLSLALHALVAAALVFGHCRVSRRVTTAELDVAKSELTIVIAEPKPEAPTLAPLPSVDAASRRVAPNEESPLLDDAARRRIDVSRRSRPPQPPLPSPESLPSPDSPTAVHPLSTPPSSSPSSARVDAPARPVSAIRPHYPRGARERGEEGDVTLEVDVSAEGTVTSVRVFTSSGFSDLDKAALEAVRKAHFTPAMAENAPLAQTVRLTLRFRLR